ncbi:hypothetical protein [uncultured Amphritea sp.]|uniref:hypothetical protein n=1 Tax=Amphritea sp. TaxID=1872502 RepID=UPI00262DA845|nr:hypothetical protein [uncultured Amphritea sp.]
MNDFTLDELNTLIAVFEKAGVADDSSAEALMFSRIKTAQAERAELESMDFDDCLGGACKL